MLHLPCLWLIRMYYTSLSLCLYLYPSLSIYIYLSLYLFLSYFLSFFSLISLFFLLFFFSLVGELFTVRLLINDVNENVWLLCYYFYHYLFYPANYWSPEASQNVCRGNQSVSQSRDSHYRILKTIIIIIIIIYFFFIYFFPSIPVFQLILFFVISSKFFSAVTFFFFSLSLSLSLSLSFPSFILYFHSYLIL